MMYNLVDRKENNYRIILGNYFTDFNAGDEFTNMLNLYFSGIFYLKEFSKRKGTGNRCEKLLQCSFTNIDYKKSKFYAYCFQTEGGGRSTLPGEGRIQWRKHSDWAPDLNINKIAFDFMNEYNSGGQLDDKECYIFSIYKRDKYDNDIILSAIHPRLASSVEFNSTNSKSIQFKIDDIKVAYENGVSCTIKNGNEKVIHFKPRYLFWYMANRDILHEAGINDFNDIVSVIYKYEHSKKLNEPKKFDDYNTIYFGAPGTGKSYKIKELTKDTANQLIEKITFHPEYDHASFVGCYKPISDGTDIKYEFSPQVFTNIYIKAWKDYVLNGENSKYHYLVIDEINRGNCAEIFGNLFQLLDRTVDGFSEYSIAPDEDFKNHLIKELGKEHDGIKGGEIKLPPNFVILATMNTSDQSLYPMDSAFKRRWDWIYMPIEYGEKCSDGRCNDSYQYKIVLDGEDNDIKTFDWIKFIKAVNEKIKYNPNLGADKQIGNYFVKAKKNANGTFENIAFKYFVHKVMFYLWNDVFKDESLEESIFVKKDGEKREILTYQDLFPIESNGIEIIEAILDDLGVEFDKKNIEGQPVDTTNTDAELE